MRAPAARPASQPGSVPQVPIAEWLAAVAKDVQADIILQPTKADSPEGGLVACAVVKADPDAGKFPLKDKDSAMASAFAFLRSKVRAVPCAHSYSAWKPRGRVRREPRSRSVPPPPRLSRWP